MNSTNIRTIALFSLTGPYWVELGEFIDCLENVLNVTTHQIYFGK